jgi:hypothetical protein
MFTSDPRAGASGIHALGRALPVWGVQPRRMTGFAGHGAASAPGPRPAIRVEWGTMAFGQSGVSMLNDVA